MVLHTTYKQQPRPGERMGATAAHLKVVDYHKSSWHKRCLLVVDGVCGAVLVWFAHTNCCLARFANNLCLQ